MRVPLAEAAPSRGQSRICRPAAGSLRSAGRGRTQVADGRRPVVAPDARAIRVNAEVMEKSLVAEVDEGSFAALIVCVPAILIELFGEFVLDHIHRRAYCSVPTLVMDLGGTDARDEFADPVSLPSRRVIVLPDEQWRGSRRVGVSPIRLRGGSTGTLRSHRDPASGCVTVCARRIYHPRGAASKESVGPVTACVRLSERAWSIWGRRARRHVRLRHTRVPSVGQSPQSPYSTCAPDVRD